MSEYSLSEAADLDLDEIWEYIAQDNIDATDRWIAKLFDAGIGHRREDITNHPVLFFPVGQSFIIYRAIRLIVEIVAVTQGARDIPSFLQRRLSR